jgi:hypothetical protein
MDQYNNKTITLQQYKDGISSQVTPFVTGLNKSSHNDDAMHAISYSMA